MLSTLNLGFPVRSWLILLSVWVQLRARFQKRSTRDRLRYDPVILIGQSHPTNADHQLRSRSAHQIEKIRNRTVYCQLNHDINHSLGNLELKIRGRDWIKKRQTDGIYSWRHNGRCGDVIYECRYESFMASSVHAHSVCSRYNTVWTCHI